MKKIKCFCGKEILFNDKYVPKGQKFEVHCLDCGAHFWIKKPEDDFKEESTNAL